MLLKDLNTAATAQAAQSNAIIKAFQSVEDQMSLIRSQKEYANDPRIGQLDVSLRTLQSAVASAFAPGAPIVEPISAPAPAPTQQQRGQATL
jgi:hypothetical protein